MRRGLFAGAAFFAACGGGLLHDDTVDPPPLPDGDPTPTDDDSPIDDDSVDDDSTSVGDDDSTEPPLPTEARALWVTRWNFSDAADVEAVFDDAALGGFNVVFFQVRGRADAFYSSTLEPWARELTGTLGADPGWDPLQTAIDAGAARGIEVHAWLNTFPAWSGPTLPPESTPSHPLLVHPDWLVADNSGTSIALNDSYVFFSPGNPAVRSHIAAVAGEIASRYAVDGIHLDYIRYPGAQYSHDAASVTAWEAAGSPDWHGWQQEQVLATAQGVRDSVLAARPGTTLSAAVWGIYEDLWGWNTSEGLHDYDQDSLLLVEAGAVDVIVPMIYWPLTDPPGEYTDYRTLVEFFGAEVAPGRFWAGLEADYDNFAEVEAEIEAARLAGAAGVSVFAWTYVEDRGWWDDFGDGPFSQPASAP